MKLKMKPKNFWMGLIGKKVTVGFHKITDDDYENFEELTPSQITFTEAQWLQFRKSVDDLFVHLHLDEVDEDLIDEATALLREYSRSGLITLKELSEL